MTFKEWFTEVDRLCLETAEVSIHDLTDQNVMDWYQEGITPEEAVERTLEDEGFPFEVAE